MDSATDRATTHAPLRPCLENSKHSQSSSSTTRRWSGWHYTIIGGAAVTAFSLLCNIILLAIGVARYDNTSGRGKLSAGSCSAVPMMDTGLHIGINILSALILGASNAAMQCLSAPTRADLDKLHLQGRSADIGLNGFRNLKVMSGLRRVLWTLLLLSSVPLHLIYNSVVVSTVTSWQWAGYLVTNDFIQGANHPGADWNHTVINLLDIPNQQLVNLQEQAASNGLERMEPSQCMQTFAASPVYGYSSVLFVVDSVPYRIPTNSGSLIGFYDSFAFYGTTMQTFTNITWAIEHNTTTENAEEGVEPVNPHSVNVEGSTSYFLAASWPLFWNNTPLQSVPIDPAEISSNAPPPDLAVVSYCLARPTEAFCSVDTLPAVQAVVVVLNTIKLVCMLTLLLKIRDQPLITLGDAIASFLTIPDSTTEGTGPVDLLLTKRRRNAGELFVRWAPSSKRHRWFRGVSPFRWAFTGLICIAYWSVGAGISGFTARQSGDGLSLANAFNRYDPNSNNLQVYGEDIGVSPPMLSTVTSIIFANSFQLILSIAYFQYNGVVTSMLLSREWTNFARYRKGLRVSTPQGSQRRTFWLSLPYAYNMPLLALASLLHWLLSESLYYQEMNVLDGSQAFQANGAVSQSLPIGRSQNGVLLNLDALSVLVIFALCCMVVVVGLGFRRYAGGIPIVRSNSMALSYACHERPLRPENPLAPIAWGVRATNKDGTKDIGLSSGNVELMDPSSLNFNATERLVYRFKGDFHARVNMCFGRKRRSPSSIPLSSESMEMIVKDPLTSSDVKLDSAEDSTVSLGQEEELESIHATRMAPPRYEDAGIPSIYVDCSHNI